MKQLLAEEEKEQVSREEPQPQSSSSASGSKVCPATITMWWYCYIHGMFMGHRETRQNPRRITVELAGI